jgi:hypothetical protein
LAFRRRVVPGRPVIALVWPVLAASGSVCTLGSMIGAPTWYRCQITYSHCSRSQPMYCGTGRRLF